jgi:hypothetical protein
VCGFPRIPAAMNYQRTQTASALFKGDMILHTRTLMAEGQRHGCWRWKKSEQNGWPERKKWPRSSLRSWDILASAKPPRTSSLSFNAASTTFNARRKSAEDQSIFSRSRDYSQSTYKPSQSLWPSKSSVVASGFNCASTHFAPPAYRYTIHGIIEQSVTRATEQSSKSDIC